MAQLENTDSWVNRNFHSISVSDTTKGFADMMFLKDVLKDKRVVALGEQTHEDGSTFEARMRIVEFLVEEMDFDVIIFESGMFDMHRITKEYNRTGDIDNFKSGFYYFWRNSKQNQSLFSLLHRRRTEGKPLETAGFDCRFSASDSEFYLKALDSALLHSNVDISNPLYNNYKEVLDQALRRTPFPRVTKEQKIFLTEGSAWVQEQLAKSNSFFAQMVRTNDLNLLNYANRSFLGLLIFRRRLVNLSNRRDELMAENLNYLLDSVYNGKKVILFGATFHFVRNTNTIKKVARFPLPIEKVTVMGHFMKTKYNMEIFTLGFTAYSGRYGYVNTLDQGTVIKPAQNGSLEKRLYDLGCNHGMLVINGNDPKPDWWYKPFTIRLFTYKSSTACSNWSNVLDAVFFVKEAEPAYRMQ